MGGIVGLDYQAVIATATVYDFALEPFEMAIIQEYEKSTIEKYINNSKQ